MIKPVNVTLRLGQWDYSWGFVLAPTSHAFADIPSSTLPTGNSIKKKNKQQELVLFLQDFKSKEEKIYSKGSERICWYVCHRHVWFWCLPWKVKFVPVLPSGFWTLKPFFSCRLFEQMTHILLAGPPCKVDSTEEFPSPTFSWDYFKWGCRVLVMSKGDEPFHTPKKGTFLWALKGIVLCIRLYPKSASQLESPSCAISCEVLAEQVRGRIPTFGNGH